MEVPPCTTNSESNGNSCESHPKQLVRLFDLERCRPLVFGSVLNQLPKRKRILRYIPAIVAKRAAISKELTRDPRVWLSGTVVCLTRAICFQRRHLSACCSCFLQLPTPEGRTVSYHQGLEFPLQQALGNTLPFLAGAPIASSPMPRAVASKRKRPQHPLGRTGRMTGCSHFNDRLEHVGTPAA